MDERDWLARALRGAPQPRLRAVAYRMLGSLSEADDAVQEAWLRLSRTDADDVENLGGWLTTVVARVSLNMLRSRNAHREEPLDVHVPEPIVDRADGTDPEHEALLADSVGLALLVVLETLSPAERLAFVLHDMFAVPFDEIAPIVDRTPDAARQLASRARRRVQGGTREPDADLAAQRAGRRRVPGRRARGRLRGAGRGARPGRRAARATSGPRGRIARGPRGGGGRRPGAHLLAARPRVQPALVNGAVGPSRCCDGEPFSVGGFTVRGGKIVEIDILADPERLRRLDLTILDDA